MENGETTIEGVHRETLEEACARIEIKGLYTLYNLPHIDQVHLFFLCKLLNLDFSAGRESLEVKLFTFSDIPWDEIAFPPVTNTLKHYFSDRASNQFPVRVSDVVINPNQERVIKPHNWTQ